MNTKLIYPLPGFILSDDLRLPIKTPPNWTIELDLAHFRAWSRWGPLKEGEHRQPPPGLSWSEGFPYVRRILAHAHTELQTAIAVLISFDRKEADITSVHLLRQLPMDKLVEAYIHHCMAGSKLWASEVVDYCEELLQVLLHAEAQFQQVVNRHAHKSGSVNLYELCQLVKLLNRVAHETCAYRWHEKEFEAFFKGVVEGLPGVDFRCTYGIDH